MNEILNLAQRQGYITAARARSLGANEHLLGDLTAQGRLIRVARGVYLVPGDRFALENHELFTRAMLESKPFAYASHHSALALHEVALFGVPWDQVHLAEHRDSSRRRDGCHWHVLRPGDHTTKVGDYRSVSVPLSLAQVSARFGVTAGLVSLDSALAQQLCTKDDVEAILKSGRIRRGAIAARRALFLADGRAESPGESRLRAIIAELPLSYDLQVNVGGPGYGYRVDLLVEGLVAIEFDGRVKYEGARGREALVSEKVREDYIRSRGFGFMRVMWRELDDPAAIRRKLLNHLTQTRARRAA